jgi:hypothetical protein
MVISWTDSGFAFVETSTANTESDLSPAKSNLNIPSSTVPQTSSPSPETNLSQSPGVERDREKTFLRYQEALDELEKALKDAGEVWENFKTPKFSDNVSQADTILQLQSRINETLDAQENATKNPEGWGKVKKVIETVFITTRPYANVLLMIVKRRSLVYFIIAYSDIAIATKSV